MPGPTDGECSPRRRRPVHDNPSGDARSDQRESLGPEPCGRQRSPRGGIDRSRRDQTNTAGNQLLLTAEPATRDSDEAAKCGACGNAGNAFRH